MSGKPESGPRRYDLLAVLSEHFGQWMPAAELASRLGCSESNLRNMTSGLVRDGIKIETGPKGTRKYRLTGHQPCPLPPPPDPMHGREREIGTALQRLGPGKVVVLQGAPGYGTSAVAKAVVQAVANDDARPWPAAVEYFEMGAAESGRVLQRMAAQLQVGRAADPLAALATRLARPDTLVVLDRVDVDREACAPLVNKLRAKAGVLLAARWPLDGHIEYEGHIPVGALPWEISPDGTSPPPAVRLFVDHAFDREPNEASLELIERICKSRNGNPALIVRAASHAATRSLQDLADTAPDAEFRVGLEHELDRLDEDRHTLLVRLSVLRDSFAVDDDTSKIAKVSNQRKLRSDLQALLGSAVHRADHDPADPRYRLDPLLGEVLAARLAKLPHDVRDQQDPRTIVVALARRLLAGGGGRVRYVEDVDRYYQTIRHALRFASVDERIALALALIPYWQIRGRAQDGLDELDAIEHGLSRSRQSQEDLRRHARIHAAYGYLTYLGHGDLADARRRLADALGVQPTDSWVRGLARLGLGLLDQDPAPLEPLLGDPDVPLWMRADARVQRGWAHYRASEFAEAGRSFALALEESRETEQRSAGDAQVGLAWVYRRACNIREAEGQAVAAEKLAKELGDVTLQLDAVNAQIEFLAAQRKYPQALEECQDAETLLSRGGVERARGRLWGTIGEVRRSQCKVTADLDGPRRFTERSLAVAERLGLRQEQMWRHFALGLIHSLLPVPDQAKVHFTKGLELATDPRYPTDRWQACRFRQRLARWTMIEDGADAAVPKLLAVAFEQLELGVIDDLLWTLVDLEVAACEKQLHELSTTLRGARVTINDKLRLGMTRNDPDLKSTDAYSWRIADAAKQAQAALSQDARNRAYALGEAAFSELTDLDGLRKLLVQAREELASDV